MKYLVPSLGAVALGTLLIGSVAFADTTQTPQAPGQGRGPGMHGMMGDRARGIMGQVTAESGTTLTVTSRGFGPSAATTTYTVDATNAKIDKAGTAIALSAIAVGDSVMVEGTISGSNVTATAIHNGVPPRGAMMGGKMGERRGWDEASTSPRGMMGARPPMQGNGQPLVGGTVSAVSGNTITITNNNAGSTYTIDASNAKVTKAGASVALTQIAIGDAVLAQGTVNGTNIVATTIIDQGVHPAPGAATTSPMGPQRMGGFMGGIGGFFRGLFGF